MTAGGPAPVEVPPDSRPGALLLGGLRRGALFVFAPVFVAGQLIAFAAYAVTGWDGPWAWGRVGLATSLTSVRVAFDVSSSGVETGGGQVIVATGALTIAVLVLSFRAGREQARGLEGRPPIAVIAGAAVGLGFGVPAFVMSPAATLTMARFGIDKLQPVLWQALVLPIVVAGSAGAVGAAADVRDAVSDRLGDRVVAACRGGAVALWWGVVGSFVALLVIAAASPRQVGEYARALDRASQGGAVALAGQALLLPNISVLVLGTSMGATTTLTVGTHGAVTLTTDGVDANGAAGAFVLAVAGVARSDVIRFPWWFEALAIVPGVATILGGRAAAADADNAIERTIRGAASGIVFAALSVVAAWAASIAVPAWWISGESVSLGASLRAVGALGLAWGVLGGAIGGAIRWPVRLSDRA